MRHGKASAPSRCPAGLLLTAGRSHPRPTSYSRHLVTRGRKGRGVSQPNYRVWLAMGPWTSFFTPDAGRASFLGRVSRPGRNRGRFQRSHTQAKTWSARVFELEWLNKRTNTNVAISQRRLLLLLAAVGRLPAAVACLSLRGFWLDQQNAWS